MCVLSWVFNALDVEHLYVQCEQLNGFSPVCTLKCVVNLLLLKNFFPHWGQLRLSLVITILDIFSVDCLILNWSSVYHLVLTSPFDHFRQKEIRMLFRISLHNTKDDKTTNGLGQGNSHGVIQGHWYCFKQRKSRNFSQRSVNSNVVVNVKCNVKEFLVPYPYLIIDWERLGSTGGPLRSGPRGGTGPWGQYKTSDMQGSIRAKRDFLASIH